MRKDAGIGPGRGRVGSGSDGRPRGPGNFRDFSSVVVRLAFFSAVPAPPRTLTGIWPKDSSSRKAEGSHGDP